MNKKLHFIAMLFCMQPMFSNAADVTEGENLFAQFRCADCHGVDARTQVSKTSRPIAGMNPDQIYTKTKRFIETRAHDNVITGCGEPPSTIQIKKIADYLATLPK
ncbi:MAG: c-type cytochrome [Thiobacillus sp.]|nr:c-type cytochrome [Thiobacillus sp.]